VAGFSPLCGAATILVTTFLSVLVGALLVAKPTPLYDARGRQDSADAVRNVTPELQHNSMYLESSKGHRIAWITTKHVHRPETCKAGRRRRQFPQTNH
jgi:hypothetical protein